LPGSWESFFVAQVGASAALTGLVFVALSINLERIIGDSLLVGRAGEALMLLLLPVVLGLLSLMSDVAIETVGAWGLGAALVGFVGLNRILVRARAEAWRTRPHIELVGRVLAVELAVVPLVVGAAVLLSGSASGFDVIAVGGIVCLVVGIGDAWVLLVEILR
jgi:modulator of FtsH protease